MKRIILLTLICILLVTNIIQAQDQIKAVSKKEYMAYVETTVEEAWKNLDESRKRWRERIDVNYVFGYNPPGNDAYLAALFTNLYEIKKDKKYLNRIKELLVYYGEYKKAYPADFYKTKDEYAKGLPALPNIFTFSKYVQGYECLKRHGKISKQDQETIENNIAESADFLVNFQEWGPMNRAMLRAEALTYGAKVLPNHPNKTQYQPQLRKNV